MNKRMNRRHTFPYPIPHAQTLQIHFLSLPGLNAQQKFLQVPIQTRIQSSCSESCAQRIPIYLFAFHLGPHQTILCKKQTYRQSYSRSENFLPSKQLSSYFYFPKTIDLLWQKLHFLSSYTFCVAVDFFFLPKFYSRICL